MKKILGVFMILGITYCSVAEKQDDHDESTQESTIQQAPCDSIEKIMYDEHGTQFTVKMPCDTAALQNRVPGDTVVKVN